MLDGEIARFAPRYAKAEQDGAYSFSNVPPGSYRLVAAPAALILNAQDVQVCLSHFGLDRFPLSNSKTAEEHDPRGLGEYFARNFGSSVFASHFAALWVHQGLLEVTRKKGAWWFRFARSSD